MITKFTKNVNPLDFQKLLNKFTNLTSTNKPLWQGTVYVGTQPLYIECHVKWMAEKINTYFVDARQNVRIDKAKEVYILNEGVNNFVNIELSEYSDLFFVGDNIFSKPDFITNRDFIFLRTNNACFISVSDTNPNNVLYLDENHLLARLFYYLFDSKETTVLHAAAVAYEDCGILITGLSGSGKSTLAAYCLASGMKFVGDDKIALHKDNGILYANPVYSILSLKENVKGIQTINKIENNDSGKDVFVLDKSIFSKNIKIRAVVEVNNANLDKPEISETQISPIITKICTDYSLFSVLSANKNPLNDYKTIFDLFSGIPSYKIKLSKSISDNVYALVNLANKGHTNV